jgi:hypothetical protein
MSRFLHEGANISYGALCKALNPRELLVATWLTNRRSRVLPLATEAEFNALIEDARRNPAYYHLRFFGTYELHNSYFDYNPSKGPRFVDRGTPHWKVMAARETARFTVRPDDIAVITGIRKLCVPWCEPFSLLIGYDWVQVVPGFHIRRVADADSEFKYRLVNMNNEQMGCWTANETIEWSDITEVLQLRKSPARPHETEFRYYG